MSKRNSSRVPVQMYTAVSPVPMQMRAGEPIPGTDAGGGESSPAADLAGTGPVPVQMRQQHRLRLQRVNDHVGRHHALRHEARLLIAQHRTDAPATLLAVL